jgi:hypothetical protein
MAAAALTDTVLAGNCGGSNWSEALEQTNSALDAMELAAAPDVLRILVHFLWNWAELTGIHNGIQHAGLSAASVRWLEISSTRPAAEAASIGIDSAFLLEAKNFCTSLIASAIGRRLKSWEW